MGAAPASRAAPAAPASRADPAATAARPVRAVHQISPAYLRGDAVGAHMAEVRRTLQGYGLASEIYVENLHPATAGESHPLSELPPPDPDTVLMYQLAIGSVAADVAHDRPETLVVNYHNSTPSSFFRSWDRSVAGALDWARAQLGFLGERAGLGIGVSAFNAAEMVEAGYASTAVAPILFNPASLGAEPDRETMDRLAGAKSGADLLFVGRLAPNKAQHDLVKVLAAYRAVYDGHARLHLLGRPAAPAYTAALRRFVAASGLADAVEIADEGVSGEVLSAYYASADVLVSASEHEGFCVPLLEAMHHRLPVVAYAAAAVPETLGGAGLALDDKAPLTMAAAIHRVLTDDALRTALALAAAARLEELSLDRSRAKLLAALAPLTGIPAPEDRTWKDQ
ncbi:MAG: glycosyltransferase family 4 protein [Acidimicrobiales bacterium]